ncbi:Endoribonuclease L-PSP [Streptomyces zhaozhouensis]|uniref:Endoribonuclease L-PSP n=1 Tax=Streptomyces zhaozhouensis TaxID=1300267 RepID=A0A286DWA0_9ACTN|nr:RidA family protein [Streptomyces zhaozhouensis]SOD62890.1 Endoribonuclease L-PSP [Streptomyces zhaozhouensis]
MCAWSRIRCTTYSSYWRCQALSASVLGKIRGLLQEAGLGLEHVARVTAFLADPSPLGAVNEVYREFFTAPYPSRSAVGAALPKPGFLVEIEALAVRPSQPED